MCAIAGIVAFDTQAVIDKARLQLMGDVLAHRGPDEEGAYSSGNVGLAHRRLSIIDLRHGQQPMRDRDTGLWLTYNGEIYNFQALRAELLARGCAFETHSDTEVVLKAYAVFGEDCVERLRGMFAFAIWDAGRKQLFLARDRLGIKPLYYAIHRGELIFASEIKAILAAGVPAVLNAGAVPELLANRFVGGEATLFGGVRKLLPGHVLTWSHADGVKVRRYWHLPETLSSARVPFEEQAERLRDHLDDAVRSHLVSDVPVGLFLSGGLDSSGLGALMAPMMRNPLQTFSVGFDDAAADESAWARLAARAIGSEHHEVTVTPGMFFESLPRLIWQEDEPIAFPSSVPLYFLSRLAAGHVKVVMSGEGADELFLGYNRYRVTAWNERFSTAYERTVPRGLRRFAKAHIGHLPGRAGRYLSRSFLGQEAGIRGLFFENFAVFPTAMQAEALRDPLCLREYDPYAFAERCYRAAPGGCLEKMSHADLQTYLVELLMKQDQMSMAASLESRVPFLDHQLVEQVAAMPASYKLRGWTTKAVLRETFAGIVPAGIRKRRKMGFPTPVSAWLRGAHAPLLDEYLLSERALSRSPFKPEFVRALAAAHRAGEGNHGDRLWLLLNLEMWQRIFLDGEKEGEVREFAPRRRVAAAPVRHSVSAVNQ